MLRRKDHERGKEERVFARARGARAHRRDAFNAILFSRCVRFEFLEVSCRGSGVYCGKVGGVALGLVT